MAKVIAAFKDATDPKRRLYKIGEDYDASDERIAELAAKGFVEVPVKAEVAEKPKATKKPATKKTPKKSA